jgi:hypothetical protein
MKGRLLASILAAIMLALGSAPALADYGLSQQPNELAIRLGALFPSASLTQQFGGNTEFFGGVDYLLSTTHGRNPSAAGLYFDYMTGTQRSGYVHAGGLGLTFRTRGPVYTGAGFGIYNTAVRTPSGTQSGNSTGGGGKVFVGFDLGDQAALQIDYHFAPTALGVSPNGLGVEIGYRL